MSLARLWPVSRRLPPVRCFSVFDTKSPGWARWQSTSNIPSAETTWTGKSCLADHVTVMGALPKIFGAYAGANKVDPQLNEAIMLAVNSQKQCPYCTGLHGELGRMAGLDKAVDQLLAAGSVAEVEKVSDDKAITYARLFADCNGRGQELSDALAEVAKVHGDGKAISVDALCWFLHWGSVGGNTLNSALRGEIKSPWAFVYVVYYGPLFGTIKVLSVLLRVVPQVPPMISGVIGVILATCASVWVIPLGLLGSVFG